ncbi:MAG: DICT sensory domain-containing protein [Microcystaceae cyanobacterium]
MNSPFVSDRSLYQLTQQQTPPPQPFNVKVKTFQVLVRTLIGFLTKQSIQATLWVKLPQTPQWLGDIETYHQQGLSEDIYLFQVSKGQSLPNQTSNSPPDSSNSRLIPVSLEASSQLKREYFLIILSPQFCCLLLAIKQPNLSTEIGSKVSMLKVVYDFSPKIIETVISSIKLGVTITDSTPESLLLDTVADYPLPSSPQGDLMGVLLRQQIKQMENVMSVEGVDAGLNLATGRLSPMIEFDEAFIQGFTNELSTPLTSLKTALSLLETMQHKREQRKRYLDMLQKECNKQYALLSGVQDLIQMNQPLTEKELSVKLEDVIPGIVSTYQPLAEEKGIFLGYTITTGLPLVACPLQWLSRILRNLIDNSMKFTPTQGRIQVQADLKNEMVLLIVTDTGTGIENSDLPKIYQSFYRGRNARIEAPTGVGLGLTLVKSLVEACGGTIGVSSQLEKGTVVTLTFPMVNPE